MNFDYFNFANAPEILVAVSRTYGVPGVWHFLVSVGRRSCVKTLLVPDTWRQDGQVSLTSLPQLAGRLNGLT